MLTSIVIFAVSSMNILNAKKSVKVSLHIFLCNSVYKFYIKLW